MLFAAQLCNSENLTYAGNSFPIAIIYSSPIIRYMASQQVRANLFGTFALWQCEEQLDLPRSASARALLAYLLLHRGQFQSRNKIAGIFWADMDEARARKALTQALWRIRKFVPDILEVDAQQIRIPENEGLLIDVSVFEKKAEASWQFEAASPDDKKNGAQALHEAVELYKGVLLEGFYDDWVLVARERLREMYLRTLEYLIEIEKKNGAYTAALDVALRLAQADPYREAAHREVMRLYYALDRPEAALSQYETCFTILEDELGLQPDRQTRALAQEIALRVPNVQAPYLPKTPSPVTPWLFDESRPAQLPLLGRENEREALTCFMEEAIRGFGGTVLIEGEAGIGKTRLMNEVIRDAEWRGVQSLWGRNLEGDVSSPYSAIIEALAGGLTALRINQLAQFVEEIWFRVLAPLVPQLYQELPGLVPAPTLPPKHEHERLVQAFANVLSAWGQITPVLLVLDDLHWSNETDIDLLIALTPLLHTSRVLMIGTFRGEDAQVRVTLWQKIGGLNQSGIRQHIILERLSSTVASELIRRSLGISKAAPLFEMRLYQETLGNPLFILETLRALHDEGLLEQDEGGEWHTPWDTTTSDYRELPLPQAVENTIATRLARLSSNELIVLSAAAVLGREFNFSLLSNTTGMELSQVLTIANALVRRRFLEELPTAYRFTHDKIRQVAYQAIPPEARRELHKRAGENLLILQPDQIETLAHHFTEGHLWDQAATHNRRAGDRAKSMYANRTAALYYARALEAFEKFPGDIDPVHQFELRAAREAVYALLGERENQKTDLDALTALLENLKVTTPERRSKIALRWVDYWEAISDYPAAIRAVRHAVEQAKLAGDKESQHQAHVKWGQMLRQHGDYPQARQHLEIAYQLSLENRDPLAQAISLNALGVVFFNCGNYDAALDYSRRALEVGQPTGDQALLAEVHNALGGVFHFLADFQAGIDHHQRSLNLRRAIGDRRFEISSLYNLAITYSDSGDLHSAREKLVEVCDLSQAVGDRRLEGYGWVFLGLVLEQLGELDNARDAYSQGLELRREVGLNAMANDPLAGLARCATAEGNHATAVSYAEQVLDWIEENGTDGIGDPLLAYVGVYRALLAAGESDRGLVALQAAYNLLMQFAENIADPERRRAYLHDIDPGRPIWNDYHKYILGQSKVLLPCADAPLGRPLLASEWVEITWTANTPEDEKFEGKTERRQHQLLRLVQEAQEQAAAPTVGHLAKALGVSDRTIKRDLAALRDSGHIVATRGA